MDDGQINIILEDSDEIDLDFKDELNITNDHSKLNNLDFEHSGHTGFAPASILSNIIVDEENEALLIGYVEEES